MNLKHIFLLAYIFCTAQLFAQTSVQVVVAVVPPYQQNISDYQLHPERIVLKLINTEPFEINVQIAANLSGNNGVNIKTKAGFRSNQPIRIPANTSVDVSPLQIIELFDLSNLEISGTDRAVFENTGILPEGDYKLCVRAYNFRTLDAYSQDEPIGCSNIIPLYNIEPPIILNPITESEIKILPITNVIFNWTTPAGAPPNLNYVLRVVEVPLNRNHFDAMISNAVMPVFEQTVIGNTFIYSPGMPELLAGRKYAAMVTAKDPTNKMVFRNAGKSEVIWFTLGANANPVDNPPPPPGGGNPPPPPPPPPGPANPFVANESALGNCGPMCTGVLPDGPIVNKPLLIGDELKINKFKVTITKLDPAVGGKYSGEGLMPVPFINSNFVKLRVVFKDIEVNTNLQVLKGRVDAKVKPGGPNLVPQGVNEAGNELKLATKDVESIVNFVTNDPLQQVGNSLNQIGFEMPLGINSDPFMLAVTEVVVTTTQAYFSVVTSVDIPENNDNIALTARNICMDGNTDICGAMELYLSSDFNIDALGLKLIAPKRNNGGKLTGTFMRLVKNANNKVEVKDFNVLAEYTFPQKSLIDAATKSALKTTFEFNANNGWANWKAELTLPEFYVDGVEDVKFDLAGKKATYDHSDIENPVGLPSPYTSGMTGAEADTIKTNLKTWHGLYFPQVTIKLPDVIKSNNNANSGITLYGRNLLFDKSGFTGAITAENLLSIGDGSLAGWYASIDTIKLNFWKSTFKNSKMIGRVVLPPCGSQLNNKVNQLDYHCLLTNPKDKPMGFQFVIKPKEDMQFAAFYAKVRIDATTQILVETRPKQNDPSKNEIFAQARLDGIMTIDDKIQKIPGMVGLKMDSLEFKKIIIQTAAPYTNDSAIFKFNSPQKTMAGFSYSITNVGMITELGSPIKVGIKFTGNLNFIGKKDSKFSLAAQGTFGMYAKVGVAGGRPSWEGVGVLVDDVQLGTNVDLGAIKLSGALKFYNKENPSNAGFVGALSVKLPSVGIGVAMKAQFGVFGSGTANSYNYFNLDALAEFGEKGIPMFAGVNLYGLGGAVQYNMTAGGSTLPKMENMQNQKGNAMDAAVNKSPLELLNYSPSGLTYIPSKGSFGFSATAAFGLAERNTLDADATFTINFNENGGIDLMKFKGTCRVVTDVKTPMPARTQKSLINGALEVQYDFVNEKFNLGVSAELKYPYGSGSLIRANGALNFETSKQGWFLHVGRPIPSSFAEINVANIFIGKTYFEAGTYNIDPMPPIPDEIKNLAGPMANQIPAITGIPRGGTTAGFVHGAYTYFKAGGDFLMFYGSLAAGIGYDIAYKKYEGFECEGVPGVAGNDGWYATGQAYLGVNAKLGIDLGSWFGKVKIFEGGAVATIMAGLPNPSWAKGAITGYYDVLGLFSGTFNYKFTAGEPCSPILKSGLDFKLVSEITPENQTPKYEISGTPQVVFNFRVNKGKFIYAQQKDDGGFKDRYLKFDRSTIKVSLTGGGQTFGDNSFAIANGNALYLNSDNLLLPNTNYTFKVIASIHEAQTENGNYTPIKVNGKDAQEEETITFTTNNGLTIIPNHFYVNSYPLHSHQSFIEIPGKNKYSVDFTKIINPSGFDVADQSKAKIYAVYFLNDQAIDNKLVTVQNKMWTFDKINTTASSNYRIEFVVKVPENNGGGNSTTTISSIYAENNTLNFNKGIGTNISRAVKGLSVGYIKFATSKYSSYDEKYKALEINKFNFRMPAGGSYTISKEQPVSQNKLIFTFNVPLVNGEYSLTSFSSSFQYSGELFSWADAEDYTTDDIFKNGLRNLPQYKFKALSPFVNQIYPNANEFISTQTGIPLAQIKTKLSFPMNCSGQGTLPYMAGPVETTKIGAQIKLPYVQQFVFAPGNMGIGFGQGIVFRTPVAFEYTHVRPVCAEQYQPSIQLVLNGLINPVVNPVGFGMANNAGAWSAFNAGVMNLGNGAANFGAVLNVGNAAFNR